MSKLLAAVIVSIVWLGSAAAHAQGINGVNGNASVCNGIVSDVGKVNYGTYGVNDNDLTLSATVICPVNLPNPLGGSVFGATIYARNSTVPVSCSLLERDTSGNGIFRSNKNTTGVPGSGPTSLQWQSPPLSKNMVVSCSLPPLQSGAASHVSYFFWTIS
jgi:hypothetical protein